MNPKNYTFNKILLLSVFVLTCSYSSAGQTVSTTIQAGTPYTAVVSFDFMLTSKNTVSEPMPFDALMRLDDNSVCSVKAQAILDSKNSRALARTLSINCDNKTYALEAYFSKDTKNGFELVESEGGFTGKRGLQVKIIPLKSVVIPPSITLR